MRKKILSVVFFTAVILLNGCATAPVQPLSISGLEQSGKIAIEDHRPASETEKKIFSYLITSEAYGIYRIAESVTDPVGVRLLAHRAYESLPALEHDPVITVNHFVTYANFQSEFRRGALGGAIGGAIGSAIISQGSPAKGQVQTSQIDSSFFDQTEENEYRRAFYTEAENPDNAPVNIIYIETEILGRTITTRSLVPPLKDKPNPTLAEVIDLCIANHLALYRGTVPASVSTDPSVR